MIENALFRSCKSLITALFAVSLFGLANAKDERPNVLFISVDDLNDWVGALGGNPQAITPNIDRLASQGVTFTRAYCAAPLCNPSREALMSGRRPSTTGIYGNKHDGRNMQPEDTVLLNQQFYDAGYYVAGAGKIYHTPNHARKEGWHKYVKRFKGAEVDTSDPDVFTKPLRFGPMDVEDDEISEMRLVKWAVEEMNQERAEPFFLAVGLFRPHMPWYAPRKYFDMHPLDKIELAPVLESDLDDIPPIGQVLASPGIAFNGPEAGDYVTLKELGLDKRATQGYLATTTFADACIGVLLDGLEASGKLDNTIVILWGDHGWHFGEKRHWRKHALWEESTRTPIIVSYPGNARAGAKSHRTVNLLDIYPTLLELCGIETDAPIDGDSFAKLLSKPNAKWNRPTLTTFGYNNHSVRSERYRYTRYADGGEELYDHKKDPLEHTNLSSNSKYDKVKADLAKWMPTTNVPDTSEQSEFRDLPGLLEKLKSN